MNGVADAMRRQTRLVFHQVRRFLTHMVPPWFREARCAACASPRPWGNLLRDDDEKTGFGLCAECLAALRFRRVLTCSLCGLPVARGREDAFFPEPEGMLCGTCLQTPPPWSRCTVLNLYEGPLRAVLLRAKFQRDAALMRVLGELLAMTVKGRYQGEALPEVVIPVPLHPVRLRERGYNQCLELARPLVYRLSIPTGPSLVERIRPTHFQRGLTREERLVNVRTAFSASPVVRERHVLLLDDIMTTGSTLRRVTDVLLAAGARRVDVAVVARVPRTFF